MWQTKYASAVPKNLGVGVDFRRAVKAISSPGIRSPWQNLKEANIQPTMKLVPKSRLFA